MNGILMLIRNSRTSAFLNNGGTGVEIVQQMLGHAYRFRNGNGRMIAYVKDNGACRIKIDNSVVLTAGYTPYKYGDNAVIVSNDIGPS